MTISIDSYLTQAGALGDTVAPGHPEYDEARQSFNLAVDQRPAAIAFPERATDVQSLVRAARTAGLRVAVQGGMHNPGPQGDLADALLIKTQRMDGFTIYPSARRARVEAGVLWEPVVDAAAEHGLAALHGSSPDVGIVGYSLGGGLGWLARKHGLQTHRITTIDLVTADGALRRVDRESDPDLFWALRGGGGNFGVVTALEFELLPITHAYAGAMAWDWTRAEDVLQRWAAWAPSAPDEVTTSARIMQFPDLDIVPPPLRARQMVVIDGAVLAGDAEAERILAPLRELGPELDMFQTLPMPALTRIHGDPEEPLPSVSETQMLAALPPEAVSAFVAATGPGSGSSLVMAELRQLGGAIARPAPGGGAVPSFDGQFLAFALGMAPDAGTEILSREHARRALDALEPWHGGRQYLNFVEEPADASIGYAPDAYRRLREIRRRVDPTGLFRAAHVIA